MALLVMIFRKMLKNKWLVLCLLLGMIISVALISSIPMYTQGVLQRMLTKDMEQYQLDNDRFPGGYLVSHYMKDDSIRDRLKELKEKKEYPLNDEKILEFYR